MKALLAVILVVVGVWLIHSGWTRRQSLTGKAEATWAELGKKWDGESRLPEHYWQLGGGAVLALVGVGLLFAKRKG